MQTVFRTGAALEAAVESLAADDSVEGLLLLTTPTVPDLDETLSELPIPVAGGIFPQVVYEGETRDEGGLVVGVETAFEVLTIPGLSDQAAAFEESLSELPGQSGTTFVFVDAYATEIERFIDHLFRRFGVTCNFVGGGAGMLEQEGQPCLYTNDGRVADAAVIVAVDAPSTIGVRHGWEEIAGPFRVTAADGPSLESLDGEPAFDTYRTVVDEQIDGSVTRENFFEIAKRYPFGISRMGAEKVVRDPFEVSEDGSLTCFGDVPEGEYVHILQGDPDGLIEAAGQATADVAADSRDDLLVFDCISRALYLDGAFDQELTALSGDGQIYGALTIGEIANDGEGHLDYYNKTAVVAGIDDL